MNLVATSDLLLHTIPTPAYQYQAWSQRSLRYQQAGMKTIPSASCQYMSDRGQLTLSGFFNSPEHSDITLRSGDDEIHAHKVILAQGSPYFRQLFAQQDKDQQDETITLKGEPDALKGMLAWLYGLEYYGSDRVENRDQARYPEGSTDVCRVWCSADAGSTAHALRRLAPGGRDLAAACRMPLRYALAHNDEALARKFYATDTPPELKRLFAER
ncbi:protein modification by small protein conjugation [Elasticomyces elasticus]|nr:protein modification by small protein conjugation [Elasticomyces elasticus]KAK4911177.1 protein modification by small protein conjugation [Elasticomyces elasticus]